MSPEEEPRLSPPERWALARDAILFALGAAGFLHELISGRGLSERPVLLGLSGLMMGLGKTLDVLSGWLGGRR